MLEHYGNEYGEIDVKLMLSDAGVWSELPNRRAGVPHDGFYPATGKDTGKLAMCYPLTCKDD